MISVIVPIYHGESYIDSLIKQIENAQLNVNQALELILVNDDPNKMLAQYQSDIIAIQVLQTTVNRGIHGARIRGLTYSQGEIILFLDQDDKITPLYFVEQLKYLADADGVICQLIGSKKLISESMIEFNTYISNVNIICSPGQVLLLKKSIPEMWKKNVIVNNGADDWLLWICMLKMGYKFKICPEELYEHVNHDKNASCNDLNMFQSEREVLKVLHKEQILTMSEEYLIQNTICNLIENRLQFFEISKKRENIFRKWLYIYNYKIDIESYCKSVGKLAIYGAGKLGLEIYEGLCCCNICIECFIDQNAKVLNGELPRTAILPGVQEYDFDCIIISVLTNVERIKCELQYLYPNKKIIMFETMLDEILFSVSKTR